MGDTEKLKSEISNLKDENRILRKIIENESGFPDLMLSPKGTDLSSPSKDSFIFGFWEYNHEDQCFILDDLLKNFMELEYNILDFDSFRKLLPGKERKETVDTFFLAIENRIGTIRFEQELINPADGQKYVILFTMNNSFDSSGELSKTEGSMINISELLKFYRHSRAKISNEKYIDDYSGMMNRAETEGGAIDLLLKEICRYRPSRRAYLLCREDENYTIHSFEPEPETGSGKRFSYSVAEDRVYVNRKRLSVEGFLIKSPDFEEGKFYNLNSWLEKDSEMLLVLPVINSPQNFSFAVVDISSFSGTLSSPDIITYHAMMHIFEGTLKRLHEETEHQKREMQYQLLVEQTPHMLCQILPEGSILFVNRHFSEYFGIPLDRPESKNLFSLLSDAGREKMHDELNATDISRPEKFFELEIRSPDGSLRKFHAATHTVFHATGNPLLINMILEDLPPDICADQASEA